MKKQRKCLHSHPKMQEKLGVDKDHVIIDRDVFEELLMEKQRGDIGLG